MHHVGRLPDELLLISDAQEGLFSTAQAAAHLLSVDALAACRSGEWISAGRGLWCDAGWQPPEPIGARLHALARRRARRVQLVRPSAVACDEIAAELLRMDGWWSGDATRHSVGRGDGHRAGWRRRDLAPDEVVEIDGLRVTSPLRTARDLVPGMTFDATELLVESVLRLGLVSQAVLWDVASEARLVGLGAVLASRAGAPPTESMLETLAVALIRRFGIETPSRQVEVGKYRVDLAWPALGVFIELDGEAHDERAVYDQQRQNEIVAMTGWTVVRLRWSDVVRAPKRTAALIAASLAARQVAMTRGSQIAV